MLKKNVFKVIILAITLFVVASLFTAQAQQVTDEEVRDVIKQFQTDPSCERSTCTAVVRNAIKQIQSDPEAAATFDMMLKNMLTTRDSAELCKMYRRETQAPNKDNTLVPKYDPATVTNNLKEEVMKANEAKLQNKLNDVQSLMANAKTDADLKKAAKLMQEYQIETNASIEKAMSEKMKDPAQRERFLPPQVNALSGVVQGVIMKHMAAYCEGEAIDQTGGDDYDYE